MRQIFESLGEIHGLSWVITIVLDVIWNFPELTAFCSIGGIPSLPLMSLTIFIICFVIVTLIQRFVSNDEWEKSATKGLAMGVIAAVPFSIVSFVGRNIYKGVQNLIEENRMGSVLRPWRDFENLARAKAISLGFPVKSYNGIEMKDVISFLAAKGVIAASDESDLQTIRSRRRNPTTHTKTKMLGVSEENLLQKYIDKL